MLKHNLVESKLCMYYEHKNQSNRKFVNPNTICFRTPEDYPVFGPSAINNPPFCGMPYGELDLNRITAVPGIGFDGCYTCLKVSNAEDSSKCVYVMVVVSKKKNMKPFGNLAM